MCEIERKHSAATQVWSEKKVEKSSKYFIFFVSIPLPLPLLLLLLLVWFSSKQTIESHIF